eukprot:192645-Rhodomonas_salina.1
MQPESSVIGAELYEWMLELIWKEGSELTASMATLMVFESNIAPESEIQSTLTITEAFPFTLRAGVNVRTPSSTPKDGCTAKKTESAAETEKLSGWVAVPVPS